MMTYYFVKRDLYGVRGGSVERFAPHRAGQLLLEGAIEPYDERRHGKAPGAPAPEAKEPPASRQK